MRKGNIEVRILTERSEIKNKVNVNVKARRKERLKHGEKKRIWMVEKGKSRKQCEKYVWNKAIGKKE